MIVSVFMIDTVGAHRGMHYYNFPLTTELKSLGLNVTLVSTNETSQHHMRPMSLPVLPGFKGIYGHTPKPIRGLRYAVSLLKILRWAKREKPNLVHFHFFQIPILDYYFFEGLKRLSIKRVITVHDVVPFEYGVEVSAARQSVLHKLYQHASGLILNSNHSMQKLAELDTTLLSKATVIQQGSYTHSALGPTTSSSEAKSAMGIEANAPIVLVFGTIKPNKRLDLVIKAIGDISKTQCNIRLLIAGQTQDRQVDSEMALVRTLGVTENVIWKLGRATDEEMMLFFSAADIVVFPYQWIYQSAALLMAMSLGKVVIATAVGSNEDVIIDGETGLLVSIEDAQETAVAIQKLLDNPQYAKKLATAAQKDVEKRFSWKTIALETQQFYKQLLLPKT